MTLSRLKGSLALAALLLPLSACASYGDVPSSHPNKDAIEYLQQQHIASGYPDGTFKPENTINRAEFTKIIVGATLSQSVISDCTSAESVSDVPDGQWYTPYVCAALDASYVAGYPDGTFRPTSTINFVEAAKILSNAFLLAAPVDGITWYEGYVNALDERSAIPTSINRFDQAITRGEMAEMIYRLKAGIATKPSKSYEDLAGVGNDVSDSGKAYTVQDLRKMTYPGSDVAIERDLGTSNGVHQYIVSYLSEGLKLRAEMSVPTSARPAAGYPVVILCHGSVDPARYDPLAQEKYIEANFAKQGYLILKPDYRGHGQSEGDAVPIDALKVSPYGAVYAIDVMNLLASVGNIADADPRGVVLWGHSLGSKVATWVAEVSTNPTLKAAVLVSGPAPLPDEFSQWKPDLAAYYPNELTEFATLRSDASIGYIHIPLQTHYGTGDEHVPQAFNDSFNNALVAAGKDIDEKIYPGANHAYSNPKDRTALQQNSLDFFARFLGK